MKVRPRFVVLAGVLLVLALGVATSRVAAEHPDAALGGGDLAESIIQVGAAVAAAAAGLRMALDRGLAACGMLLALTGLAILLAQLPAQDSGSASLFTAALVGAQLAPFLAGSAALACPVVPVRRPDWAIIAVSLAVAVVIRGLLSAAILIVFIHDSGGVLTGFMLILKLHCFAKRQSHRLPTERCRPASRKSVAFERRRHQRAYRC
jgi:hypothetical protein